MTRTDYLLDSNICIEILRGNKAVKDTALHIGIDKCHISVITMIELRIGEELAKSKPNKYVDQRLDGFMESIDIFTY